MHHGGSGFGNGPQERVHQQLSRAGSVNEKCPYEVYQAQIPDCCAAAAAAAAAQDAYPRPPSGYDGRCSYDECHRKAPYQDESYPQVTRVTVVLFSLIKSTAQKKVLRGCI